MMFFVVYNYIELLIVFLYFFNLIYFVKMEEKKMVKKIIGKTAVDYVSKKTNQRVSGINLHCCYEDRNTEGVSVERLYISSRSDFYYAIQNAPIGSEIEIYYNCWGKVEFVQVM